MANENPVDEDLLGVLTRYAGSWSDLIQESNNEDTNSILNAVTAANNSALREALVRIDSEIRLQADNVSAQTFVGHDSKLNTEPILPGTGEAEERESDPEEATFIGDSSAVEATLLGSDDADDSARHTTWAALKAPDGTDIPATIGNYDVHSVLGRGGMGVVYRARQRGLKRDVAIKMILAGAHADAELFARFRAEAEAVAQLQHPNIVQIYEIGEHEGLPYFSLEYVEGQALDGFRDSKPVAERKAAELLETICRAMHFAHNAGIVHRDLKPANILLSKDGEPKVTDFGLVKRLDADELADHTQAGAIMGTPNYMAPEQAWGKTDINASADIWALGALLYVLLTGRPPFAGSNTMDTLVQLKSTEPVAPRDLVPKLSVDIETICIKCLQKEPERRYASAQEMAEDLRRYLDGIPILARPVGRAERSWRWCRRNPVMATLAAGFVFVLVAGSVTSTAFGIKANKSAIAEADAREDADEKRLAAEVSEKRAMDQRRVALGAFNTAVEWAGTDLKNVPGTEQFKKRLFAAAVEGLNRLSEITGDDRRDLAIARGYAKAGEGLLEVGQAKEARTQFAESHEIVERLAESESEDTDETHFLRLGRSYRNIGRAEMALNGPSAAVDWHQQALDTRKKALPLHADPLFVKQELADSYGDLGRAFLELGQSLKASEMLAHCAEYRDEWLTQSPGNDQAVQKQAGLRRQIGMVRLGLGDTEGAVQNLQLAVQQFEPFTKRESAGSRDHLNLGLFRSGLADALLLGGRNEDASKAYQSAIASIELVREQNPTYVPAMKFLAGALCGLSVAEAGTENSAAAQHLAKCIELRREMVKGADSNKEFQRELMLALARSGETEEAMKIADEQKAELSEDAGVLYQIACVYSLLSRGEDGDGHAEQAVMTLQEAVDNGHEGLALMAVDPDLEPLRERDDFQSLVRETSKSIADKQ